MTVKKIAITIICLLCVITSSHAKVKMTFSPEIGIMGGTTEYEMDLKGNYIYTIGSTTDTTIRRLTSLLEFPLDVTIGGLSGEINPMEEPSRWSIKLKYLTNLNHPSDKMIDTDWDEIVSKFPYMKFSYTESNAEMNMTILDLEARFRIAQRHKMDISIIAGGRYQKIEQDLIGLEGWQKKFIDSLQIYNDTVGIFSGYENVNGLYYKIEYKQFKVGFLSDIYLSDRISSQIKIAFAPVSFKDVDDHILRYKLSTGKGNGSGYIAGFNLRYDKPGSRLSFIQLSTSYNSLSAEGSQTQEWYADELRFNQETQEYVIAVKEDTIISGLPHTIRSKQYSISLQIGIEL